MVKKTGQAKTRKREQGGDRESERDINIHIYHRLIDIQIDLQIEIERKKASKEVCK